MQRLIKITSFLLLAIWLPATLHCDLEAANINFLTHEDHHHDHDFPAGDHDDGTEVCHSIEDAAFTASAPSLKIPPPADSLSLILSTLLCLVSDYGATFVLAATSHPPPREIAAGWQFLTRAAPPARAPSLNA